MAGESFLFTIVHNFFMAMVIHSFVCFYNSCDQWARNCSHIMRLWLYFHLRHGNIFMVSTVNCCLYTGNAAFINGFGFCCLGLNFFSSKGFVNDFIINKLFVLL